MKRAIPLLWLFLVCVLGCSRMPAPKPAPPVDTAPATPLYELKVTLDPGSTLDVYYQREEWRELAINIAAVLRQTRQNFKGLFQTLPPAAVSLALIDRDLFRMKTESPTWIHAIYYQGKIFVPLSTGERINYRRLYRSLKHEYTHAVISGMSAGRCPGWIDEGLSQWAEGEAEPASLHLLASWLLGHRAIPLQRLQGGFLTMPEADAKVSYAQSRFAVQDLINTAGMSSFERYFEALQQGAEPDQAFAACFGVDPTGYEKRLQVRLTHWANRFRDRDTG